MKSEKEIIKLSADGYTFNFERYMKRGNKFFFRDKGTKEKLVIVNKEGIGVYTISVNPTLLDVPIRIEVY